MDTNTKGNLKICVDGSATHLGDAPLSLEELQEAVGGLIEVVYLPDNRLMIVNEEGRINGLLLNRVATQIARQPIVGDVVVMPSELLE